MQQQAEALEGESIVSLPENPDPSSTSGALEEFHQHVAAIQNGWSQVETMDDDQPQAPVFLDLLSGPHFPLAQAFEWAGWKIVHPIDILIATVNLI